MAAGTRVRPATITVDVVNNVFVVNAPGTSLPR
jgi:hypothetical protein